MVSHKIFLTNQDKELERAARESAFGDILEEAQEAFWAVIVAKYPEVKSGDFTPEQTFAFNAAIEEAVKSWLYNNLPCMTIFSENMQATGEISKIIIVTPEKREEYDIGQIVTYEVDMNGYDIGIITPEGILSIGESAKKWIQYGQSLSVSWQEILDGECNPIREKISLQELMEDNKAYKSLESELGKIITFSMEEVSEISQMTKAEAFKYGIEKLKTMTKEA